MAMLEALSVNIAQVKSVVNAIANDTGDAAAAQAVCDLCHFPYGNTPLTTIAAGESCG